MTPQTSKTLNDILAQLKAGTITQDAAARAIERLFAQEPANYRRRYSDKQSAGPSA